MTFFVVACGSSAEWWHKHPRDKSILVNDAFKFGVTGDYLGIWNHRGRFTDARLQTILSSRPIKLYTHSESWREYFPEMERTNLRSWDGYLRKESLTTSDTSPIIAINLAYVLGAKKIVVFGCDFINHHQYNRNNGEMKKELRAYRGLCDLLNLEDVRVSLGAKGSLLEEFLPVETWQQEENTQ